MKDNIQVLIDRREFAEATKLIDNSGNALNSIDLQLFQAKIFFGLDSFSKAKTILEELLSKEHIDEALMLLSKIYLIDGNPIAAEEIISKLSKEVLDYDDVIVIKAEIYYQMHKFDTALSLLIPFIDEHPEHNEALKLYINILISTQSDLKLILETIKRLKKIQKTDEIDYLIAKAYYEHDELDNARKHLKRLSNRYPNSEYLIELNELLISQSKIKVKVTSNNENNPLHMKESKNNQNTSLEDALKELDNFIGLDEVKTEVKKIVKTVQHNIERNKLLNIVDESKDSYHFMFYGNPGTGKTTVARILGNIFFSLGILEKPDVVEVDRSDLVGEHIGETAVKTKKIIDSALGGILFIDEAYALAKGESFSNDFGVEAIDTLLKAMEDHRDNFIVILAGYEEKMKSLMLINEGLESRINKKIKFDDYNDSDLVKIARIFSEEKHYSLTSDAEKAFLRRIGEEQVKANFANARDVRNVIQDAIQNRAVRLMSNGYSIEELTILEPIDFGVDLNQQFQDDFESIYIEFENLIGLSSVKKEIKEIVNSVKTKQIREQHGMKVKQQSYHMMFLGNPGTGKTMMAAYIGKLFKALGILKRGHVVEASREDFVAPYIGQTATKTKNKIQEAYGGILFIDEAYSLNSGSVNDFGKEAVDVLIQEMENNRDKLIVIMAGYTQDMKDLLSLNRGLESRITYKLDFPDYTSEELASIFLHFTNSSGYVIAEGGLEKVEREFHKMLINNDGDLGNGRLARKVFEQVERFQGARILQNDSENPREIRVEDITLLS